MFQVPAHCSYVIELYPIYPKITIIISSKLHTYGRQGWISYISGDTSCGLPGSFTSEVWSCWGGEEKRLTLGSIFKVVIGGYFFVSGTFTL